MLDYGRYQIWYDCDLGEPHRFNYQLDKDNGDLPAKRNYRVDKSLPAGCKGQHSSAPYSGAPEKFERGHLAPINHFDDDQSAMDATNVMTNLVPQYDSHNAPTWYRTELITDCFRDIKPVKVIGGVVFGHDPEDLKNDYFVASHGIATPEFFWKVLLTEDASGKPTIIAWWIPHQPGLGSDL
ncbi:TPA: DNA/RNA non-specific endonuclease, partial [Pseudomonas aeruginosa]